MQRIRVEQDGPVKTVTLTRGNKRNAIDTLMLEELLGCFSQAPSAADRVVVLRAEGPSFCAGMDLAERGRQAPAKGMSPIEPVLHAMEAHPLPLVAVVHGDAIAGGNELALHCDIVVAASSARFGMSLAQIGLAPTWGLAKKLMDVAGPVATREILLLGDPLAATRFHELGLISHVAEPDELDGVADQIITRLAQNAPLSLRAMKALLNRQTQYRDHVPHADIDELVNATRASADAKEGMQARLEKRQPKFNGE
jgi:enoyl-CoA hydratase/carnithine racemase